MCYSIGLRNWGLVMTGQAELRKDVGKAAVWTRAYNPWGGFEMFAVEIVDVKIRTQAWYIVQTQDGRQHRVKIHNVHLVEVENELEAVAS